MIPGPGAQRRSDPGRLGRHVLHVETGSDLLVPVPDRAPEPWSVQIVTDAAGDDGRILEPVGPPVDVINNFGTELLPGGFGTDRCFRVIDDGSHDADTDVFSFSGGGVLFRRAFLDDVGLFDPRFFTYYEDLDLGWRGTPSWVALRHGGPIDPAAHPHGHHRRGFGHLPVPQRAQPPAHRGPQRLAAPAGLRASWATHERRWA